ncbi:glutaredoxin-3 [Ferrovum myxofaciens]|uniref:Glutaredoxin n=4 Tax=root TaxID=1 RepID=A0A149W0N7_9PROT|nr:glutaredoxin 3 [Ferrovum myxofaciens]KXW59043.1 glutaredoxin-3 [Ferrovum myxofaciens]
MGRGKPAHRPSFFSAVSTPMPHVQMYCTALCPYCVMAEKLLTHKGVTSIEKIRIDLDLAERDAMIHRTGCRTVPQIYIGQTHVGGFDDLAALDRQGLLDPLLDNA